MSKQISKEDVQLYYQIALAGRRDLIMAPDPRSGFEMTLIRMLAFRPLSSVTFQQTVQGQSSGSETGQIRMTAKVEPGIPEQESRHSQISQSTPDVNNSGIAPDDWQDVIDEMALAGLVKEFAGHCILREHTKDKIHLVLSPAQEHLLNTAQKDRLHAALKTRFGDHIKMVLTVENPDSETPAQRKIREEQERQLAAEKSVKSDPNVQLMKELFDASVDTTSIRPENN